MEAERQLTAGEKIWHCLFDSPSAGIVRESSWVRHGDIDTPYKSGSV